MPVSLFYYSIQLVDYLTTGLILMIKGTFMKDVRSQGLTWADMFRTRETGYFFAKKFRFFENYDVPHGRVRKGYLRQCGRFLDKGVNFSWFCADVFYDRSLIEIFYRR